MVLHHLEMRPAQPAIEHPVQEAQGGGGSSQVPGGSVSGSSKERGGTLEEERENQNFRSLAHEPQRLGRFLKMPESPLQQCQCPPGPSSPEHSHVALELPRDGVLPKAARLPGDIPIARKCLFYFIFIYGF